MKLCCVGRLQVDGVVIRTGLSNQDPDDGPMRTSKRSQDATGRYDLLFGIVTGEAIWRFSATDIQSGFEGDRRDKILRTYVRNAYTYHLSEIFYTVRFDFSVNNKVHLRALHHFHPDAIEYYSKILEFLFQFIPTGGERVHR